MLQQVWNLCSASIERKNNYAFSSLRYPLYLEGSDSYRFHIPEDSAKQETFKYNVKLPDGVTCVQCVIQWIYYAGLLI